jgi:NADPH:quinone reductase-like Zn-dependent oxidoreductase
MSRLIRFERTGGPEVLQWVESDLAPPAPGEAQVRHHAVGLNYIDVYHRSGLYPVPLPSGLGLEAAGVVEAVGAGVSDLLPGDRVAYAGGPWALMRSAATFRPTVWCVCRMPSVSSRGGHDAARPDGPVSSAPNLPGAAG